MHDSDVALAIEATLKSRVRGVFNVAGPQPVPLSVLIKTTGRTPTPLPEFLFRAALGRFGLPRLPPGALAHIKYPVVIDDRSFRSATGYRHRVDEIECMRQYRQAFPILHD
jgi:UDP-glucose 4-epimerase